MALQMTCQSTILKVHSAAAGLLLTLKCSKCVVKHICAHSGVGETEVGKGHSWMGGWKADWAQEWVGSTC